MWCGANAENAHRPRGKNVAPEKFNENLHFAPKPRSGHSSGTSTVSTMSPQSLASPASTLSTTSSCGGSAKKKGSSSILDISQDSVAEAPMSELAQYLDRLRNASPEEAIDATLSDIVDRSFARLHEKSVRGLPDAKGLLANVSAMQRELVVNWLIQACDIMHFSDSVLYSTVLTLDRYCSVVGKPIPMDMMQKVLMATVCTVLKMSVADDIGMPLKTILPHLCRHQVSLPEILHMEQRVLITLGFEVSTPSALEFLDILSVRLEPGGVALHSLANFLLQLSLLDAQFHYMYPHLILAAAALFVALRSLAASPRLFGVLLKDLALACPGIRSPQKRLASCASGLHSLWVEHARSNGTRAPYLLAKFSSSRYHQVATLSPPSSLGPLSVPCTEEHPQRRCSHDGTSAIVTARQRRCSPMPRTWREVDMRRATSADGARRRRGGRSHPGAGSPSKFSV